MKDMAQIAITEPSGMVTTDNRPGHTVAGLLHALDPFQRRARVRLGDVTSFIARWSPHHVAT